MPFTWNQRHRHVERRTDGQVIEKENTVADRA
jgi:hypothetical protein